MVKLENVREVLFQALLLDDVKFEDRKMYARPCTIHGRKRCAVRFWLWTARRFWTKRQPAWRNCYDLQTDP